MTCLPQSTIIDINGISVHSEQPPAHNALMKQDQSCKRIEVMHMVIIDIAERRRRVSSRQITVYGS